MTGRGEPETDEDAPFALERQVAPGESIAHAIAQTVAVAEGTAVEDLPPLGRVVDTDAFAGLFDSFTRRGDRGSPSITFEYHGYYVCVEGGKRVTVSPTDA